MQVDILLSNRIGEDTLRVVVGDSVCGVIDVIRATSTITTLLAKGIGKIIIADSKKDALSLKKDNGGYLLCGEEGGLPPRGFDYGNSPLELSRLRNLKGKNAILKTTNGTVSFFRVKKSVAAYSMSILNLDYTVDCMAKKAREEKCNILLVCSGEAGRIAYDDVFVAGLAIKKFLTKGLNVNFTDTCKLVLDSALAEKKIDKALEKSISARLLKGVGLGEDIDFCSKLNRYSVGGRLMVEDSMVTIKPC